jgi:hypothetical protein
VQKGPGVVMLERSEASGGGVKFDIYTFLQYCQISNLKDHRPDLIFILR